MLGRRIGVAVGTLAIGAVMGLVPALPAGASKGGLCSLNKSEESVSLKSTEAVSKAIESGNWAAAKKALLSSFSRVSQAEQLAIQALSGAPSNVKSAGGVMIKFAGTEKSIIAKSTSATQFETSEEAAAQSPKIASAEKTLASYFTAKCGKLTVPT